MLEGDLLRIFLAPLYALRWGSRLPSPFSEVVLLSFSPLFVFSFPLFGFLLNFGTVGKILLAAFITETLVVGFAAVLGFFLAVREMPTLFSRSALEKIATEIEKFLNSLPERKT